MSQHCVSAARVLTSGDDIPGWNREQTPLDDTVECLFLRPAACRILYADSRERPEIIVTSADFGPVSTLEELGGREVYRAAAGPINVADVKNNATDNIHAGAKMLRHKVVTYFDDRAVDPLNRVLFALAIGTGDGELRRQRLQVLRRVQALRRSLNTSHPGKNTETANRNFLRRVRSACLTPLLRPAHDCRNGCREDGADGRQPDSQHDHRAARVRARSRDRVRGRARVLRRNEWACTPNGSQRCSRERARQRDPHARDANDRRGDSQYGRCA